MHGANRSLISLLLCSLAVFALLPRLQILERQPHLVARQTQPPATQTPPPPPPPPPTTTATTATTTRVDTTSVSSPAVSLTPSSTSTASTTDSTTSVSTSSSTSSTVAQQPTTPTFIPAPSTSADVSTNSNGDVVTSVVTITPTQSSPTPSQSSDQNTTPVSSGLGTGSIIGLSVAGGIALIVIVGFFIWKLTRKRFSDFDDNEAIKWPELNTHSGGDSHPLPVNSTGRAGFDTGSEIDLQNDASDPYAVPPLPHLNPNQPYRDDPSATGYYDPYRGPIPNTFNDTASVDAPTVTGWSAAEAIPMTQMSRARSPGPQAAYDGGQGVPGRRSPGPHAAYSVGEDRARSPGPGVGLGGLPPPGRRSPGPQAAYPGYGSQ